MCNYKFIMTLNHKSTEIERLRSQSDHWKELSIDDPLWPWKRTFTPRKVWYGNSQINKFMVRTDVL